MSVLLLITSTHFIKNMIYSARNEKTSIQGKKLRQKRLLILQGKRTRKTEAYKGTSSIFEVKFNEVR